jgi:hypothetical protein
MTRRRLTLALAATFLLGFVLRLLALQFEPPHHPDEFFQYLEPAWRRLTGAGVQTWEWRAGVRSWVMPGYHGAWMALLMRLGVHDGVKLATILRGHWALLSLTLVWAGWRGGALLTRRLSAGGAGPASAPDAPPAGWQGGLVAALLCTAFPLLVRFSIHTLSELPSILCLVWAVVLAGEIVEARGREERAKAAWMGVLLGLGICLRIQHAPVALVAVLWLLVARRFRPFAIVSAAALLPVALFGAVDWVTWGSPFSSFIAYVKFNLLEGGATSFGAFPWSWYWQQFIHRSPIGLFVLLGLGVLGLRASWPFLGAALGLVAILSTQAHKEERFAMLFWPLVLIAAAGYAGAWVAARTSASVARKPAPVRLRAWLARAALAGTVALVLGDGALHCRGNDFADLTPLRYEAQAWAGRQPDVTGLLYDEPIFVGGGMWFGRPFPQLWFKPALLGNPLFSHVLVPRDSDSMRDAVRAGFTPVYPPTGRFVVLSRKAREPASELPVR